jgi:LL-diaminopimelate aminotransferase
MPRYNPYIDSLKKYPQQVLENRKAQIIQDGVPLYDFGVGDPLEPAPEFIRKALRDAVTPHCGYPMVRGNNALRQSISDYILRRFKVDCPAETHILPLSGAKEGVFHMPMLLIDPSAPDRLVVFPDPGYPAYYRGTIFAGGTPHGVSLSGDYIFRPWTLEPSILDQTRLLWLNTPHNPSGAVMSLDDLQRTAEVCRQYDILCVSDETYADIYFSKPPHSILECGLENVLAIHSLSKRSGLTGYRSGFVAGDPRVIQKFATFRANPGLVPQTFVNAAATVAWADDGHVAERRKCFFEKKSLFLAFFDSVGIEVIGRDATLYLWVKVPPEFSAEAWALKLLDFGIVVSPGTMYSVMGNPQDYVRLAMVPNKEDCMAAITQFQKIIGGA